jgi:alkylation response protein AidB-like acyl-CoA dehydrogenase
VDFDLTPDQERLRQAVRDVLAAESPPEVARRVVETGEPAVEPWASAVRLGWPGIAVAEADGGLGLGMQELGLVFEEHGLHLAPGPFLSSVGLFAPLVRELGDAAQRERWLGPLLAGALRGAAVLEPGDLRARRDGDGWSLGGSARFVLDAAAADECAVAARVDEGDGIAILVVPAGAAASERVEAFDASRPLAHLTFDGVALGPDRVLGGPGASAEGLARALDEALVAVAMETLGVCQRLFEITVQHAKERRQFGVPIGSFQAVQHKCVDMFVAIEKARATGLFAMMCIAEDDPRRRIAAAMAKAAAGDCQRLVCKEGIQIHGGMGFTWESDVHLFVKRAKAGDLLLGSAREHRARIADLLLDAR